MTNNSDRTAADGESPAGRILDGPRIALLLVFFGIVGAFFAFGLQRHFSLAALLEKSEALSGWTVEHPAITIPIFILIYACAIVALPPSGSMMTLVAGYVFGTFAGGSYVVIAATLGATILFMVAKTTLGDPLAARAGPRIRKLEAGFQANAFNYLLVLRLVPLFPFWLVNLAPAFLGVRLRTFLIATFFGIMPGTFVYASLGSGLNHLVTADDLSAAIYTPRFLLPVAGLVILALLPVVYKRLAAR